MVGTYWTVEKRAKRMPDTTVKTTVVLISEYWSFVVARMVIGMTTSGVFLVSYVLVRIFRSLYIVISNHGA